MKLNNAQLLAMINGGNKRYFYTRLNYDDFSHKDVEVDLRDMQELEITKTINGHRKVAAWYETDQGLNWLEQKFE